MRTSWYDKDEIKAKHNVRVVMEKNPAYLLIAIYIAVFALYNTTEKTDPLHKLIEEHMMVNPQKMLHLHTWILNSFLHNDIISLAINCFLMYQFGSKVARSVGNTRFMMLYLAGTISCSAAFFAERYVHSQSTKSEIRRYTASNTSGFGASGSLAAIMAVWCSMNPNATIRLYMVLPVPALALFYAAMAFEVYRLLFTGNTSAGAAAGHLGGGVAGLLLYSLVFKRVPF